MFVKTGPELYAKRTKLFSKIQSITYQEIPPYTTAVIKTKVNLATIKEQNNYLLAADSTFIDNNSNLKCYPILIK